MLQCRNLQTFKLSLERKAFICEVITFNHFNSAIIGFVFTDLFAKKRREITS